MRGSLICGTDPNDFAVKLRAQCAERVRVHMQHGLHEAKSGAHRPLDCMAVDDVACRNAA